MTIDDFKKTLSASEPPRGINPLLQALWYDAKGDWSASHNIAQEIDTKDGSWVHGYLHRKEGDDGNAGYWYRKAGKEFPKVSLEEEWREIVKSLL